MRLSPYCRLLYSGLAESSPTLYGQLSSFSCRYLDLHTPRTNKKIDDFTAGATGNSKPRVHVEAAITDTIAMFIPLLPTLLSHYANLTFLQIPPIIPLQIQIITNNIQQLIQMP